MLIAPRKAGNMKVTIRDIAERAQVSAASVSLVLNRKPCRIAEETRQKIFETAKEMGYVAKKERKQAGNPYNGKVIGLIYPTVENELIGECINGVEDYASVYGYRVVQFYCSNLSRKCIEQIELACHLGVSGLIVIPPVDMNVENNNVMLGEALKKADIPYLLLDKAIYNVFCDFVTTDNKLGANTATEYLVNRGHYKIGVLAGKKEVYNTRKRVEGYREGLAMNGIDFDETFVHYGSPSKEGGFEGMTYLSSRGIAAVVSCNADMALGVYEYARKNKKQIGEDISIVSFGNMREASWLTPTLTYIHQQGEQMGRKATEVLMKRIGDRSYQVFKTNYFTPTLIAGDSVKNIKDSK